MANSINNIHVKNCQSLALALEAHANSLDNVASDLTEVEDKFQYECFALKEIASQLRYVRDYLNNTVSIDLDNLASTLDMFKSGLRIINMTPLKNVKEIKLLTATVATLDVLVSLVDSDDKN